MSTNHVVFRDSFPPILENIYQYSRTIDIKVNSMNMKKTHAKTYNLELILKKVLKNKFKFEKGIQYFLTKNTLKGVTQKIIEFLEVFLVNDVSRSLYLFKTNLLFKFNNLGFDTGI